MPINRVDNAAYYHDLWYSKHDDTKTRNEVCDKTRIDKLIVEKLINAKVNFGLDVPIKAKKS